MNYKSFKSVWPTDWAFHRSYDAAISDCLTLDQFSQRHKVRKNKLYVAIKSYRIWCRSEGIVWHDLRRSYGEQKSLESPEITAPTAAYQIFVTKEGNLNICITGTGYSFTLDLTKEEGMNFSKVLNDALGDVSTSDTEPYEGSTT